MSATKRLMELDPHLELGNENSSYHAFAQPDGAFPFPTGIECEVGEFLYGLIRMVKPKRILETGTNIGISTRYMALALQDTYLDLKGEMGEIVTFERMVDVANWVREKLGSCRFSCHINVMPDDVNDYPEDLIGDIDFMWLDSEPQTRLDELDRFLPHLTPGGIACIHDLNRLDFSGETQWGPVPESIVAAIDAGTLQRFEWQNVRGLTVFQKRGE